MKTILFRALQQFVQNFYKLGFCLGIFLFIAIKSNASVSFASDFKSRFVMAENERLNCRNLGFKFWKVSPLTDFMEELIWPFVFNDFTTRLNVVDKRHPFEMQFSGNGKSVVKQENDKTTNRSRHDQAENIKQHIEYFLNHLVSGLVAALIVYMYMRRRYE